MLWHISAIELGDGGTVFQTADEDQRPVGSLARHGGAGPEGPAHTIAVPPLPKGRRPPSQPDANGAHAGGIQIPVIHKAFLGAHEGGPSCAESVCHFNSPMKKAQQCRALIDTN